MSAGWMMAFGLGELGVTRWLEKPPDPSAVQAQESKTWVVPLDTLLALLDPAVGVYRQACSGIPLAVRFVGRDRLLWNSMVQRT